MEPVELLSIDVRQEYIGAVTEMLGKRQAEMRDMHKTAKITCIWSSVFPPRVSSASAVPLSLPPAAKA
jgi:predicted membrane GTPase involved in stress response